MTTLTLTQGRVTWINIVQPTRADIDQLAERYPFFHKLDLEDCLTELEYAKLKEYPDYIFLVLQFPYQDSKDSLYKPGEVDVFITKSNLIISHHGELAALNDLFARAQEDLSFRADLMGNGASPLLHALIDNLVSSCRDLLKPLSPEINKIEAELFNHDSNGLLKKIAAVRRNLIALQSILNPQAEVIHQLEEGSWYFIHEDLDLYWGDISDRLRLIRSSIDENMAVVSGLSDTVDTLASHRINEVVRLLTIVTFLTLPMTVLATIFGMNILLPLGKHPLLFYLILVIGFVTTIWVIYYLQKRKLL